MYPDRKHHRKQSRGKSAVTFITWENPWIECIGDRGEGYVWHTSSYLIPGSVMIACLMLCPLQLCVSVYWLMAVLQVSRIDAATDYPQRGAEDDQ